MRLALFSLVYGEKFVDRFTRGLVKSLCWPRNREALQGQWWHIYTGPDEIVRVAAAAETVGIPFIFHEIPAGETPGDILMAAMRDHARRCVDADDALLAVQPDHLFGEGSIAAMKVIAAENRRLCVAMAHPRVLADDFLDALPDGPMQNAEMVSLAMRHLHPSFAKSDMALDEINTWLGGVSWRELGPSLWGVTVNSPTVFLAQLVGDDLGHFGEAGSWDHTWPATLMDEQRQRLIGSSDAAFTVELTDRHTHIPKLRRKPPGAPYTYRYDLEHNRVNRNTMTIWRGLTRA